MKKRIIYLLTVLVLSLSLCACAYTEYTATFVLGDGREEVTATVTMHSDLYEPESKDSDKVFGGWYLDAECTKPYLNRNITSDLTLYASWIKKGQKSVIFIYGNGTPDTTIIYDGKLIEPKAPKKEGCLFKGWKDEASGKMFDFSEETENILVLRAIWEEVPSNISVVFNKNNGEKAKIIKTNPYTKIEKPETPKREGYYFAGWYKDKNCEIPFDFDVNLEENINIYAKWIPNNSSLANRVAKDTLKSTVKIKTERYNTNFIGQPTGVFTSLGSGVIYKEDGMYYYCLTNNHVIVPSSDYSNTVYFIFDCYGNQYSGELLKSDLNYDLAVVAFRKGEKQLSVASMAKENAKSGDVAVSIGNPSGLINSVTFGEILKYDTINVSESGIAKVEFPVGWHSAPIDHGSSGGAVFDSECKLIGVNFAVAEKEDGGVIAGLLIPIEKVKEFLLANKIL